MSENKQILLIFTIMALVMGSALIYGATQELGNAILMALNGHSGNEGTRAGVKMYSVHEHLTHVNLSLKTTADKLEKFERSL